MLAPNSTKKLTAEITIATGVAALVAFMWVKPVTQAKPVAKGDFALKASSFNEQWSDAEMRLATIQLPSTKPLAVRTIPIVAAAVQIAAPTIEEALLPEPEPEPVKKSRKSASSGGDICTRHNLRKVFVGKYRWRCMR
jgi:hypothetical protein